MLKKIFAQENPLLGGEVEAPNIPLFEGGFAGLASTLLRFVYIIAGLYVLWNIIQAGYMFLSAGGDPEAVGKAWETIWKSLMGLLIIVTATVFAALIGWLFLGDPGAILAPDFSTSLNVTPTPYPGNPPWAP